MDEILEKLTTFIGGLLNDSAQKFADEELKIDYAWDGDDPSDHTVYLRVNDLLLQFEIKESV